MPGEVGASVLWRGSAQQTVIGPKGEQWDDVLLVQYPSRRAFLTMVGRADYQQAVVHRRAALADSRLIATAAVTGAL
jgi:uncharacterized protein (DUF1330 family)